MGMGWFTQQLAAATPIQGINDVAEELSWKINSSDEWQLTHFKVVPDVDFSASRVNALTFAVYRPDPDTSHIDAFIISRLDTTFHAFPPFFLGKVTRKIITDKSEEILITPDLNPSTGFQWWIGLLVMNPFLFLLACTSCHYRLNCQHVILLHRSCSYWSESFPAFDDWSVTTRLGHYHGVMESKHKQAG